MQTRKFDLVVIVDTSSACMGRTEVLSSVKEQLYEITERIRSYIGNICAITYDNEPRVCSDWVSADLFDSNCIKSYGGGMSNAHFALREATKKVTEISGKTIVILMFLSTDTTDSRRILDDEAVRILGKAEKYLFKRSRDITEPEAFAGNHEYILGSPKDLDRLSEDLIDFCQIYNAPESKYDYGNTSEASDNSEENSTTQIEELIPPGYDQYE